MKYDGVVIKNNLHLYLFILDPEKDTITDGVNISEHECYKDLSLTDIMVVTVEFKDGTKEIDDFDLHEFVYGDKYGKYDTFIYIHDIALYSYINDDPNVNLDDVPTLSTLIKSGEFVNIAKQCITESKNDDTEILEDES